MRVHLSVILLLVVAIACKKNPDYKYVNSLPGAVWFSDVMPLSAHRTRIPFATRVRYLAGEFKRQHGRHSGTYRAIRYGNQNGWIRADRLSQEKPSHYYRVIARRGLNLRARPTIKSRRLTALPHHHIGEIIEPTTRVERIDRRPGYWFKTSYGGKTGWIVSGYTLNSAFRERLEEEVKWKVSLRVEKLTRYKRSEKSLIGRGRVKQVAEFSKYLVYSVKYKAMDTDCEGPRERIYFKEKSTGSLFYNPGLYFESMEKSSPPFKSSFTSYVRFCLCCCPNFGRFLYIETNNGIVRLNYRRTGKANCDDGGIIEYDNRNRGIPEKNKLMVFWRRPDCVQMPDDRDRKSSRPGNPGLIDYSHDLFAVIQLSPEGKLRISRHHDVGEIPTKYKAEWDLGRPVE